MVQRNIASPDGLRSCQSVHDLPLSQRLKPSAIHRKFIMTKFQTPEQFAALNQANLEALMSLANSAMARAERLAELNLNTVRSVLEDSVATTRKLAEVKDPQQFASLQGELTKPMIDKAVAYARSVQEIATEGQQEVSTLFEKQIAEVNKRFHDMLEQAAKQAPAGSEGVFEAVKSAMSTANSLYENASKAARQAAEVAEANMSAATEATVKAVAAAGKTVGKK
jgi:phasin family protein